MTDENLSELNKDALLEKARDLDIQGRSNMGKDDLIAAIEAAEAEGQAAAESGTPDPDEMIEYPGAGVKAVTIDSHGHTSASLQAALDNANASPRLVTEEQILAQSPPPA